MDCQKTHVEVKEAILTNPEDVYALGCKVGELRHRRRDASAVKGSVRSLREESCHDLSMITEESTDDGEIVTSSVHTSEEGQW